MVFTDREKNKAQWYFYFSIIFNFVHFAKKKKGIKGDSKETFLLQSNIVLNLLQLIASD